MHINRVPTLETLRQTQKQIQKEMMDREYDTELSEVAQCVANDPYMSLKNILREAHDQASCGKGKERHAKADENFSDQKICEITRRVGLGYPHGQAIKKIIESQRLPKKDEAVAELLGAINYIAASIIVRRET